MTRRKIKPRATRRVKPKARRVRRAAPARRLASSAAPTRRARLRTNIPPPGWTPEEDRREEQRMLSEITLASKSWWPD
jgi:hypothetical protein